MPVIQILLGHDDPRDTMISTRKLKAAPNPLETLAEQPGWEPVTS